VGRPSTNQKISKESRKAILESISAMKDQAKQGNVQAFKALLEGGGIAGKGINITTNVGVGVGTRSHGDTEADWKFFQKFRGKLDASILRQALPEPDETEDTPEKEVPSVERTEEGDTPTGVSGES
jgi:hypothetical protein